MISNRATAGALLAFLLLGESGYAYALMFVAPPVGAARTIFNLGEWVAR